MKTSFKMYVLTALVVLQSFAIMSISGEHRALGERFVSASGDTYMLIEANKRLYAALEEERSNALVDGTAKTYNSLKSWVKGIVKNDDDNDEKVIETKMETTENAYDKAYTKVITYVDDFRSK
ncbi:MAG: hypothetical protein DRQ62_00085 [Gammaproteobacteria bacterium]|nr:MAG: hypothetical protein DRQ62_00085 [Gammaproteobacteria bacterium]